MLPDDPRHGTTTGYRYGCHCKACKRAVADAEAKRRKRLYLNRTDTLMVPGLGTHRRIQALVALGWNMSELSRQLGDDRSHIKLMMQRPLLRSKTAQRIEDLYDKLSMTHPPEGTKNERIDATRARNMARRNGWAPPLAWNDIDDPGEVPNVGEQTSNRTGGRAEAQRQRAQNRLEDVEHLAAGGVSGDQIAARLGISSDALQKFLERQGRGDLWKRIRPGDENNNSHVNRHGLLAKKDAA